MIKGSDRRKADHAVDPFILDRWSPRAMTGESITSEELMRLFEAARWAPSSFNSQQWRALYARRETEHWPTFLGLLVEGNKSWALKRRRPRRLHFIQKFRLQRRPFHHPLLRLRRRLGKLRFARVQPRPCRPRHARFRLRPRADRLEIPDDFQIEAMAAVGKPGGKDHSRKNCREQKALTIAAN